MSASSSARLAGSASWCSTSSIPIGGGRARMSRTWSAAPGEACRADRLQCVGTSATLASEGGFEAQRHQVAEVARQLFGTPFEPEDVIGETRRAVDEDRSIA